ncbi:hypothetical protein LOTGIDRAFT_154696 [Lottia gigantea]|uniref:Uncharacterized protein n=1 Tax=Lottia gigantea TaxID=225164 RepID=V3ZS51_LOTGI|nr:hypothetical protein LOTGIDRAFT_154696 [Lottia gigantea]ESO87192.1 hypothetical protein LOTGIDRAFT_154696 [Lottia gigantea]
MDLKEDNIKYKVFFFMFVLFSNLCDIAVDWLFYVDLKELEKGLVFGPVDSSLLYAVVAFAILSTFLNIIEISIKGLQLWNSDFGRGINDMLSLIVIFLGEMPLVIMNIITAGCREESLSIFQLAKACVILSGNLIRIVFFFVTNCKHCIQKLVNRKLFCLCLIGLILNCLGSISIFILTQTRPSSTLLPQLETPTKLFAEIEENQKYFGGVSIYFQHSVFQDLAPNRDNFIRLVRIDDIRNKYKKKIFINFQFKDSKQQLQMVLSRRVELGTWETPERFALNKTSKIIHVVNGKSQFNSYDQSLTFAFDFIPPEGLFLKQYVFGEIEYNVMVADGQSCSRVSVPLFYFRSEMSEKSHLVTEMNKTPRFYTNGDLTDISKVWKTGWMECDSTGSLNPSLNRTLDTPCVNWTH